MLPYASETWSLMKINKKKIKAEDMKLIRRTEEGEQKQNKKDSVGSEIFEEAEI
jgi:hypothetical protein